MCNIDCLLAFVVFHKSLFTTLDCTLTAGDRLLCKAGGHAVPKERPQGESTWIWLLVASSWLFLVHPSSAEGIQ
jgi:hypothetical protein